MMTHSLAADPSQQTARRRLRAARLWALGLLLLVLGLFVFSCVYLSRYPALAYLKAFSEASMVGALADWFAVSALFRHPLGLPIPHTAILPRKQDKIAEALGRFIEHNFLQGQAIAVRTYQLHPTQKALDWLNQPANRRAWLPLISRHLPTLLHALRSEDVARFTTRWADHQLSGRQISRILAATLTLLHRQKLDEALGKAMLNQIRHWLQTPVTRQRLADNLVAWVGSIEKSTPSAWDKIKASLKVTLTERIDTWAIDKAQDWADAYLSAALDNPQHPFWRAYRYTLLTSIRALRDNPVWHQRVAAGKQQLLQSPVLQQSIAQIWVDFTQWSSNDVAQPDSWWQKQLDRLSGYLLTQISAYPKSVRRLDVRLSLWIKLIVERHKHQAAVFVADKVKSWDSTQMVDKLELSVGRDLQFIRINGTLVGGCIGLLIYLAAQWLGT